MRINKPGKILDNLWFLGREEACVFLLEGRNESMLINGALSYAVPDILQQLEAFHIDESKIKRFLLLHSHFDHIGVAPFFKRRYPEMVVHASARALEIFKKPRAVDAINSASRFAAKSQGLEALYAVLDLAWPENMTGEAVFDSDRIDLGGVTVQILETPGHSPCSISAYIPEIKALFPSDCGGVPNGNRIVPYGTSNYRQFEESLEKLMPLAVDYLCADHCGYITGKEADRFIADSHHEALWRKDLMLEAYERTGDIDRATKELAERFREDNLCNMVPFEVFTESHRQMLLFVTGLKNKRP
jgi:2-aminobenzoylacetyl-CoA thioesterase